MTSEGTFDGGSAEASFRVDTAEGALMTETGFDACLSIETAQLFGKGLYARKFMSR